MKKTLNSKIIKVKQYQTFEHCVVKMKLADNKWMTLISFYRLDYESIDDFFNELTELLELHMVSEKCILAGDINIHCDVTEDRHTVQLNNLISAFNLVQIIDKATHQKGHTLDVVIVQPAETKISDIEVSNTALSDHHLLSFSVECTAPMTYFKTITYHEKVDNDEFGEALQHTLSNLRIGNFGDTVKEYNNSLTTLVESKSPKVTRKVKIVENAPWFDAEYRELRKERRRAEKRLSG